MREILIGIALKLNGKIEKIKNYVQGRIQGPLTPGEIWSKVLPGIRSVKFGIMIGISLKLNGEIR